MAHRHKPHPFEFVLEQLSSRSKIAQIHTIPAVSMHCQSGRRGEESAADRPSSGMELRCCSSWGYDAHFGHRSNDLHLLGHDCCQTAMSHVFQCCLALECHSMCKTPLPPTIRGVGFCSRGEAGLAPEGSAGGGLSGPVVQWLANAEEKITRARACRV